MLLLGAIFLILGAICAEYGYMLNNDLEAQFTSLMQHGTTNPGTIFIFIGIGVAVVGLLICVYAITRKGRR